MCLAVDRHLVRGRGGRAAEASADGTARPSADAALRFRWPEETWRELKDGLVTPLRADVWHAAGAPGPPGSLATVPSEVLERVLALPHISGAELARLMCTGRALRLAAGAEPLWERAFRRELGQPARGSADAATAEAHGWRLAYRRRANIRLEERRLRDSTAAQRRRLRGPGRGGDGWRPFGRGAPPPGLGIIGGPHDLYPQLGQPWGSPGPGLGGPRGGGGGVPFSGQGMAPSARFYARPSSARRFQFQD